MNIKKAAALLVSCLLLMGPLGCAQKSQQGEILKVFFIREITDKTLGSAVEEVDIPITRNRDKVTAAMKALLSDPGVSGLESPFPPGITLKSAKYDGEKVIIELSQAYGDMHGAELAAADACVVLTLCGIDGISEVEINVEGRPHLSRPNGPMGTDSIVTDDLSLKPVEVEIVLYFSDGNRQYVVSETKKVIMRENESIEKYIIEELIRGPVSENLVRILPEDTELISIAQERGVCFVNLSSSFMDIIDEGRAAEIQALYSITNSLTAVDRIEEVQYLVEGERIYGNSVMLSYSASVGAFTDSAFEATVYMVNSKLTHLVPVKTRITAVGGFDMSRLLVERLITGIDGGGFMSMLPKGTMILDLEIRKGTCVINFSKEFLQNNSGAVPDEMMLQCLALTLSENIDSIDDIVVKVDGEYYRDESPVVPNRDMIEH